MKTLFRWIVALEIVCFRFIAVNSDCIRWGNMFDVPLEGKNVELNCKKSDGKNICCAGVNSTHPTSNPMISRGVGVDYDKELTFASREKVQKVTEMSCEILKTYHSSPQELRDLQKAIEIETLSTFEEKHHALLSYVTSDEVVRNSSEWLERVRQHMSSSESPTETWQDREYLSRFTYKRTCSNTDKVEEWTEWIEPISITARHPFGFGRCRNAAAYHKKPHKTGRSDVDYVLLQSGKDLGRHSNSGRRHESDKKRHYMMDAGTSTFDSSLYWFTCGYSQRKLSFDHVYAWEMTLLEPQAYWSKVPGKWKPYWSFFNTPVSSDRSHPDCPVKFLSEFATVDDFVSFKLDIDHPDTEMPIALSLLSDPLFGELVDEFFFELHFQCSVMTSCGWGKRVPAESHGLILDRPHVLQFFIDVRNKGIRAHIWP